MSKPFSKIKYTGWIGLDSQLTFGKFIGWTVLDVVRYHPDYISYLLDKTDIKFYPSVSEEVIMLKKPETNYNTAYR